MRAFPFLGLFLFLSLSLGCSSDGNGGGGGGGGGARIRFVHASPDAEELDFAFDNITEERNFFYSQSGEYLEVESGLHRLRVFPTRSSSPIIDFTTNIEKGGDYTFLASNLVDRIDPILVPDRNTSPDFAQIKLRFINAAPGLNRIDIYVTRFGRDISDLEPDIANVGFTDVSDYFELPNDDYQVRVTRAGSRSVVLDSGPLAFSDGVIRTIIFLDSDGGGAPYRSIILADDN